MKCCASPKKGEVGRDMPEFAYTARSSQGQDSSGVISAGSRREAIALLADQALFPLTVEAKAVARHRADSLRAATPHQERTAGRHVHAVGRPDRQRRAAARVARRAGATDGGPAPGRSAEGRTGSGGGRHRVGCGDGRPSECVQPVDDQYGEGRTGRGVSGRGVGTHRRLHAEAGSACVRRSSGR